VEDNGPGLQNDNSGGDGIGLVNTEARLFNLYGDNQQIKFSEAHPHGLIVTLEIPFQTKNGTAEK
jgi:two-component system LytT family sensor kinase